MPKVQRFIENEQLKTRILLQVHDELLFESPKNEVDFIKEKIPVIMTTCHEKIIDLNVPIKVDVGIGTSWDEAH